MKTITQEEFNKKYDLHKLYRKDKGGERLELVGYDLSNIDFDKRNILADSDLRRSRFSELKLSCDLSFSDLRGACLVDVDLSNSCLIYCDLRDSIVAGCSFRMCDMAGVNLKGCYFNLSTLPLSSHGSGLTVDEKLPLLFAALICSMNCEDKEINKMQKTLLPYAEKSHLYEEMLKKIETFKQIDEDWHKK